MAQLLLLPLLLAPAATAATVLSIGDGDTIRVADGHRRVTIRLACIDAPETAQSSYGLRSRNLLASLVPIGSNVSLRVVDTDRYGRTVAEILRGGQNVNLRMVRGGQAFAYRQYLSRCDAAAYLGAERGAAIDRLGVWSTPGGIQRPWEFRHGHRGGRPAAPQGLQGFAAAPTSQRHSCRQIGSYARAQELLQQSHTELDGDGEACESLRR